MTFSDETKQAIISAQHGLCFSKGCYNQIHSIHHKLQNTQYNNKKFPNFIQSPFNAVGLCLPCHDQKAHEHRINEEHAQMYEEWINSQGLALV